MFPDYQKEKAELIEGLKSFDWSNKRQFGDYLAQTYYYVNHSEKLLALAAARMKNEDRKIQTRFFAHLNEENAHDLMVKKDLENLGFSLSDFPERVETKIFWETQYYKIEHIDPMALMGYILLLEDVATEVCPWIYRKVESFHGRNTGTFLRVHGEEDPTHVQDALNVIESLNETRKKLIFENLIQSKVAYCSMINSIAKSSKFAARVA
ncbi:MAG: iron-containing redox enzyme family protein [Bacteriovoracaceae bacterium]|nr:iron-containing redox enzyme family protein [Bacteriovoracaceae bacterium]